MLSTIIPWRLGLVALLAFGSLYAIGLLYVPGQNETSVSVPDIKVRLWHARGQIDEHRQATN